MRNIACSLGVLVMSENLTKNFYPKYFTIKSKKENNFFSNKNFFQKIKFDRVRYQILQKSHCHLLTLFEHDSPKNKN